MAMSLGEVAQIMCKHIIKQKACKLTIYQH